MGFSINSLYFIIFSFFLVLGAILSVVSKRMVYTLLWAMVVFMSIGGLFLLLGAAYNAIVQFLVYVVAIPVLIAVSIMLIKPDINYKRLFLGKIWAIIGIVSLVVVISEFVSLNSDFFDIVKTCIIYVNPYSDLVSLAKNILGVYPVLLLEFGLGIVLTVMGICHYEK